jgi:prophage DNA circulation protein
MVTVQMSFVEVGEFEFQTVLPATIPKTQESAAELVEQNKTTFEKLYDRASLPYAKAQAVNATVTAGVNKVQEVNTLMKRIAEFPQEVQNILGSVDSLVLSGASVADSISGLVGMGFFDDLLESAEGAAFPEEVSDRFKIAAKDIKELFNFSPSVDASSASTDATIKLIQVAALGSYVQAMTRMDFESADEVFLFRDEVIAKIDSLLEETLDDDLFVRLEDLRADIIEDTDARAVNLARLTEIILPQTTPSLVLMNRLYGSIGQEQDFLERNQIPHPGFIVGAVPWKVLLNA